MFSSNSRLSLEMQKKIKSLQVFLFDSPSYLQLALFRIILCGTLFYIALWRQINISQFGVDSLIPRDLALSVYADFYRPGFEWFFWPDSWASSLHIFLILLLGFATLGLTNRFFLLLAWVIQQGLIHRNSAFLYGADTIGNLFLFYLAWTECCEAFSLRKRTTMKSQVNTFSRDLSSVFFRLAQIQICIIYAYTGFEKLKGGSWWDGTALWTVLANPQFTAYDMKFLSHIPWIFPVLTFLTIIFEVYFPAMVLNPRFKKYWLIAGIFFHLMIGLLLGLMTFSLVMLSTYVLFLSAEDLQAFRLKIKQRILIS